MPKFQEAIDLTKLELQNARIQNLGAEPGSPVEGQVFWHSTLNQLGVYDGSGWVYLGAGSGTVLDVSVATANGFAGTSDGDDDNPTLTLTCTVTGILKANGTAISAAVAGTDYLTPSGDGSALTGITVSQVSGAAPLASPTFTGTPAAPTPTAGTNTTQLATTAFVTGAVATAVNGTKWKAPVRVLEISNLTLSGLQTIQGVTLIAGDRVGVFGQTTSTQDGIYEAAAGGWTRAADFASGSDAASAAFLVLEGTVADTQWSVTNNIGSATVGTHNLVAAQIGAATSYTGDGSTITVVGTSISIHASYAGQTSIVTLGTITTGTWNASVIPSNKGGAGTVTGVLKADGSGNVSAAAAADLRAIGGIGKYTATIGNSASTSFAITQATHGLASVGSMMAACYDASTGELVYPGISINNANGTVTFSFASAPGTNAYRIVIIG